MPKLTIKEIAKIAGVSPSAVSIVLNNKPGVSEATRKNVMEIVEKLQYTPNPNSRRLLFNKTNNIAVLFPRNTSPLEHFFYSELNRVILHECESLGYNLIFTSVTIEDNNVLLPNVVKSYDVDGIIFYGDVDPLVLNNIRRFDIPFILVDNHLSAPDILSVSADYMQAAYTATKYLISVGHRDIGFIGTSAQAYFSAQTFSGFKKAIAEHQIPLPINLIQIDANDENTAYECMNNILLFGNKPTAVFCSADIYAIGATRCIKDHGLRIPEDISIIGIDDIILAQYVEPPLTTIKIDKVEMGKIAVDLLVKKVEKKEVESTIVDSSEIVIRKSTKILKE